MLNERLAADLVDRLSVHLDFNINIMDDRGVIIASRDRNRVGAFHAAAYRIVTGNESIEVLHPDDELPPGVKPGVNLPITHHGKTVGVVGITGNPREVLNIAYALKTSIEAIYEYEMYKARMERRQGIKDLFQNLLLYNEGIAGPDAESVAEKLGYSNRFLRVPMILRFSVDTDTNEVVAMLKRMPCHSRQDITFITVTHDILVFKTVNPGRGGAVVALRQTTGEYVAQLRAALSKLADCDSVSAAGTGPVDFTVYVGSLQHDFRKYKTAYAHAQWLVSEAAGNGESGISPIMSIAIFAAQFPALCSKVLFPES